MRISPQCPFTQAGSWHHGVHYVPTQHQACSLVGFDGTGDVLNRDAIGLRPSFCSRAFAGSSWSAARLLWRNKSWITHDHGAAAGVAGGMCASKAAFVTSHLNKTQRRSS